MNESSAREVLLIHAFETAEPPSLSWNESDGAWASRQSLIDITVERSLYDFIAYRAKKALQRLSQSEPEITECLATRWWSWGMLVWALLLGSVLGLIANSIGPSQSINLLAPPIIFVVLWNVVLYAWLLLHTIILRPKGDSKPHIFIRLVQQRIIQLIQQRILCFSNHPSDTRANNDHTRRSIIESFTKKWIVCSAPLSVARSAMLLHAAAGALGLGLIAGLYMRGLSFDFRVVWESTFLSANAVHNILRIVFAPVIWLSGFSFPDVTAIEAMRRVHGSGSLGVSAASWIHMYSLTLLITVVIPRFVLVTRYGLMSRSLTQNMEVHLDEKYLDRLRKQFMGDVPTSSIIIGLVAHSNSDKMVFLRTLLVAGHDALNSESHRADEFQFLCPIIEAKEEQLQLWNTPDFRGIAQLVGRFRLSGESISNVFDRLGDKERQVFKEIKNNADVILYVINTTDNLDTNNFTKNEIDSLSMVGRPVIVLINQIDTPCESNIKVEGIESWRARLKEYSHVKLVMALDELDQCWITNDRLYRKVENILAGERKLLMKRLRLAKKSQQLKTLDSVTFSISNYISRLASHFETISELGMLTSTINQMVNSKKEESLTESAQKKLSEKLENEVITITNDLLRLHGFTTNDISNMQMPDTNKIEKRGEKIPVLWSTVLGGLSSGLTVDILAGGFTFGGGAILGGLAAFIGAKTLNHGINVVRGSNGRSGVQWSTEVLDSLLENAFLRYLTIIHSHRGENRLRSNQSNLQWCELIQQSIHPHSDNIKKIWKLRDSKASDANKAENQIAGDLQPIVQQTLCELLNKLYPAELHIDLPLSGNSTAPVVGAVETASGVFSRCANFYSKFKTRKANKSPRNV